MGYDIKQKIENVYEQDITFLQNVTVTGNFTANGTFTFGDAAVDNFILKGRMSTMTAAGAGVDINATYINTYQELWEIRGTVSAWGTKDSFKLIYMRAQADLGVAGGLRCAEFYSVMNTSTTTGLSSLQNVYAEMLIRASASDRTLTNAHCIEANISVENQTGTLTLTNNIYCLYAKAQTGTGIYDYTKINGIKIAGRDDGTARVFGNALDICNPEATVCTWTKGISISTACATGIDISGACTTGINVAANLVMPQFITVGTSTDPIHWDGVASNILVYTENTDTTPASTTAFKFVLDAAHSGATTSGRLEGFRQVVRSYSTENVKADMRGLVGQMEFSGNMTYESATSADFSGCYGVIASIWSGSNVTASDGRLYPLGIFFGLETGTTLSGEDSYIYIYNYGKVCPNSVIKLYNASTPENPVYLFDHQGATLGSASGPIYTGSLDDSGTSDILCDGHIKILVGATPYYIPIYDTLA